jgi:hypothetical protein
MMPQNYTVYQIITLNYPKQIAMIWIIIFKEHVVTYSRKLYVVMFQSTTVLVRKFQTTEVYSNFIHTGLA